MSLIERLEEQFRTFCEVAASSLQQSRPVPPEEAFQAFIDKAPELLLRSVSDRLDVLQDAMKCLEPCLLANQHDLLRVAQLTWAEAPYTELLAWAVNPSINGIIGASCQQQWLETLGLVTAADFDPVLPFTQLGTDDGIPDLVLNTCGFLVVVEAKTGSGEHPTPASGNMQSVSYPEAARRRLGRPDTLRTEVVFLTPDRAQAENSRAIRTSYFEAAVSLARTVNSLAMPGDLRTLYKLIISHFATQTASFATDVRDLLFLAEPNPDPTQLIRHLTSLTHMLHLLPKR